MVAMFSVENGVRNFGVDREQPAIIANDRHEIALSFGGAHHPSDMRARIPLLLFLFISCLYLAFQK